MSSWGHNLHKVIRAMVLLVLCGSSAASAAVTMVCFEQNCFYPEIAQSLQEKQKGLMGRDQLSPEGGMLFVYDEDARPAFWMKNMRIPLDLIWLGGDGKVVDLDQNVLPCDDKSCPSLISAQSIRYVLEVSAGTVQKAGVEAGDFAVIKLGENR